MWAGPVATSSAQNKSQSLSSSHVPSEVRQRVCVMSGQLCVPESPTRGHDLTYCGGQLGGGGLGNESCQREDACETEAGLVSSGVDSCVLDHDQYQLYGIHVDPCGLVLTMVMVEDLRITVGRSSTWGRCTRESLPGPSPSKLHGEHHV